MENTKTRSTFNSLVETLSILGLLIHFCILILAMITLNEPIPIHFDFAGKPDRWGNKTDLLFLFGISLFLYISLTIINRHPNKFNYPVKITEENKETQYQLAIGLIALLKTIIVFLFGLISIQTLRISLKHIESLGFLFIPITILTFLLIIVGWVLVSNRYK